MNVENSNISGLEQVDLTNCDKEPIHQLGRIQSFAWLIAFTSDWTVSRVSANIDTLLGKVPDGVLGRFVGEIFENDIVHLLRDRLSVLGNENGIERIFGRRMIANHPDQRFDCAIHVNGRSIILEIEKSLSNELGDPGSMVRNMMSRLDRADNTMIMLEQGCRHVRALTGFDRVMAYRFADNGNGEVVGESLASGIDSFLGLHYPASDIPKQARALYIRNPFRVIAHVGGPTVDIVPQLDNERQPLDLSLAISRAVSNIHIEYLQNMGVGASLSISIIVDGKLWGLFACHHYSPRLPSFAARSMAEMFGHLFSLKLESRLRAEATKQEHMARAAGDRLLAGIANDIQRLEDPEFLSATLRDIVPNDGIITLLDDRVSRIGKTLPDDMARLLALRLNAMDGGKVFAFDYLGDLLPNAENYSHLAAGVLAIPISRKPRDYVMLFRQEQARTVSWGGNPEKPMTVGENGARLTPRGSFDLWKQEVRGRSAPFTDADIYIGETLRSVLTEVILRVTDAAQEELFRANERQNLLISELNHRVRNILALIRGIVNQSQSPDLSLDQFTTILSGRIQSLSRAHDQITQKNWRPASLHQLIRTEASAYIGGVAGRLDLQGEDYMLEPAAYTTVALVIHELMTNSSKYGSLSDSGTVRVKIGKDGQDRLIINWRELGGPAVQPPKRQGFGSTIIGKTIPHDLGGEAEIRHPVSGVEADFAIPARFVRENLNVDQMKKDLDSAEREVAASSDQENLEVNTVLLVEDNLIIAMDVEDILRAEGVADVKVAASIEQALGYLNEVTPDLAIVDFNLNGETSMPIAERLKSLEVPFFFATGYGDGIELGPEFADTPVLQKPYTQESLSSYVRKVAAA